MFISLGNCEWLVKGKFTLDACAIGLSVSQYLFSIVDPQTPHFRLFFQKVNKAGVVSLPLENRLALLPVNDVIPRIRILYS